MKSVLSAFPFVIMFTLNLTACQQFDFSKLMKKNSVSDYPSLEGPGSIGFSGDPSSGFQLGSVNRIQGSVFSIPNALVGGSVYDISAHVNSIFALNPSLVSAVATPNHPARNIPVQFVAMNSGAATVTLKLGDLRESNGSRNAVIVWSMDGTNLEHVVVPTVLTITSYKAEAIQISGQPMRFVVFGGTDSNGVYSRKLYFITKSAGTSLGTMAVASLPAEATTSPPALHDPLFTLASNSFVQTAAGNVPSVMVTLKQPIFGRRALQGSASYPVDGVNAIYAFDPSNAAQTVIPVPTTLQASNRSALLCAAGPSFYEGECTGLNTVGRLTMGLPVGTLPSQTVTLSGAAGYGASKIQSFIKLNKNSQPDICFDIVGGSCAVGTELSAGNTCTVQIQLNQMAIQNVASCSAQPWRLRVNYQTLPYVDPSATDVIGADFYAPTTITNGGVIGDWSTNLAPNNARISLTAGSVVPQGAVPATLISIGISSNPSCFDLHTQVNNANCNYPGTTTLYPLNGCNINLKRTNTQCACSGTLTYTWRSRPELPVQSTTVSVNLPSASPNCAAQ
jgi:hypothetical protein